MPGVRSSATGRVITVAKSSSARNHRNNPYVLDRAFVRVHHSAAGTLFRFRTELAAFTTVTTGGWALAPLLTDALSGAILTTTAPVSALLPWTRRFLIRRARGAPEPHPIQTECRV